ncbi:hypothetical protein L6164_001168 [Bauhinia variegata]|uniref:Uncharacterized protein n=1 Tax=Bauhinia variegata TaxID=167791 RepID=A0ACB9QA37_BAUVA|nr:hypothetical protein L6164_001168 [Bauhinia variegata]
MNGLLGVLNLSRNKLNGTIDTFPGLCRLSSPRLNSNLLRGKLPKYLATCKLLEVLDIGNNRINVQGDNHEKREEIRVVKILTIYTSVDLSCNKLKGSIQDEIGKLNALYILNLSHNALSGHIPTSMQLQSFEAASYKGNKGLRGPPLSQSCGDRLPPPSRVSSSDIGSVEWKFIFGSAVD